MPRADQRPPLARALQAAREAHDLTQAELATSLGVGQQTVSKWETGVTTPRPRALSQLAEQLEVPMTRLLTLAGYLEGGHDQVHVAASGTDLDELRREDPEAYELVMEMARTALARVRQGRR